MARLMAIPIHDKGDAVLIVNVQADAVLMGFVTEKTLDGFFAEPPSTCECLAFVEQHLTAFERVLTRKFARETYVDASITCVEIEVGDLTNGEVSWRC